MKQSERKAVTLKKIFEAATEVFASAGYEDARLDDIVARARIGKGTIYNHFKDKEELFLGTIENSFSELFIHLDEETLMKCDYEATIRARVESYLTFAEDNPDLFRMIMKSFTFADGRHGRFISSLFERQIMKMSHRDREDHLFRQERYHPTEIGGCALGMLHYFVFQWLMEGRKHSLKARSDVICDILFGGISHIAAQGA